jgi:hypothetical protein
MPAKDEPLSILLRAFNLTTMARIVPEARLRHGHRGISGQPLGLLAVRGRRPHDRLLWSARAVFASARTKAHQRTGALARCAHTIAEGWTVLGARVRAVLRGSGLQPVRFILFAGNHRARAGSAFVRLSSRCGANLRRLDRLERRDGGVLRIAPHSRDATFPAAVGDVPRLSADRRRLRAQRSAGWSRPALSGHDPLHAWRNAGHSHEQRLDCPHRPGIHARPLYRGPRYHLGGGQRDRAAHRSPNLWSVSAAALDELWKLGIGRGADALAVWRFRAFRASGPARACRRSRNGCIVPFLGVIKPRMNANERESLGRRIADLSLPIRVDSRPFAVPETGLINHFYRRQIR